MHTLTGAVLCMVAALDAATDPPKADIISPMTLAMEPLAIENPTAELKGKVDTVLWQHRRIDRSPSGESTEVEMKSILTKYDADNHPVAVTERQGGETRSVNTWENGRVVSTRGRIYNAAGSQVGEEFWQIYQYNAAGQLVDLKRGRGEKLEDHYLRTYDESGRGTGGEVRGEKDKLVYTEQYLYSGSPVAVLRRIVSPDGTARDSVRMRLDNKGNLAELWSIEDGYHIRFRYDDQRRVIEQVTDPYQSSCDDQCPLPGAIRIRYNEHMREQTFFEPGGNAVMKRTVAIEKDGSIASIRYERLPGANSPVASDLVRVFEAVGSGGAEHYIVTTWDEYDNWTEKKEFYNQGPAERLQSIYRRKIAYR